MSCYQDLDEQAREQYDKECMDAEEFYFEKTMHELQTILENVDLELINKYLVDTPYQVTKDNESEGFVEKAEQAAYNKGLEQAAKFCSEAEGFYLSESEKFDGQTRDTLVFAAGACSQSALAIGKLKKEGE
jgi:hypothetical protein